MKASTSVRCADVNVLVYAHRSELRDHDRYREWLDRARGDDEPLGISDLVLSGFLRVVTNHRIFREPTPSELALAFVDTVRRSPSTVTVGPGDRHWGIFTNMCARVGATGNTIPDVYLAALAIELGATWVTADRGFARFPGLRWEHPLEE